MRYILPLLLVLSACTASTAPKEYYRGALAPAPAPVRPGVGAPVTGQPEQNPVNLPRSPYGRILPQDEHTRQESGIWSAEPISAAYKKSKLGVLLMEVEIPYPEDAIGKPEYEERVQACVFVVYHAIDRLKIYDAVNDLPFAQRRCLLARMYHYCAEAPHKARSQRKLFGLIHTPLSKMMKGIYDKATSFRDDSCRGVAPDDDTEAGFNAFVKEYAKIVEEMKNE